MRSSAVDLHFLITGHHECGMKTEAEIRVMLLQAKELLEPPEAGRDKEPPPPEPPEGTQDCQDSNVGLVAPK